MKNTLSVQMNKESSTLDPNLMRGIMDIGIDFDTAYPEVQNKAKELGEKCYGNCVTASVLYIGLATLKGEICTLKPIIVKDLEQAGTPIEEHFMLTDGYYLVDFTTAKQGDGEFELYSDSEADAILQDMLSEPTLPARIQIALDRMEEEFTSEQVLEAFRKAYDEGCKMKISLKVLNSQMNEICKHIH